MGRAPDPGTYALKRRLQLRSGAHSNFAPNGLRLRKRNERSIGGARHPFHFGPRAKQDAEVERIGSGAKEFGSRIQIKSSINESLHAGMQGA